MMRRRYWVLLAGIVFLLVAADTVYWQIVSARLQTGLRSWIAEQRARGWDVGSGSFARGGWPLAASITVPNVTFRHTGPELPGNVSWASAAVTVSLPLLQPAALRIGLTGPQHVRIGDAPDAIVTGAEIGLSVGLLEPDKLPLALHAKSLRAEPASGAWSVTVGLLNADGEITPTAGRAQPAVRLSVGTEAIALPATTRWPLGPNISSLSIDGALNGPLPPVRDMTAWARAWRDGGGTLKVSHFALGWGPMGVSGTATLTLDDKLQPTGNGVSRLVGYGEALDRLASFGVLSRSAATAAKAVLSLIGGSGMAGTGDNDQPAEVDVPLTLQSRTLSMHGVPLIRLPKLDWPDR